MFSAFSVSSSENETEKAESMNAENMNAENMNALTPMTCIAVRTKIFRPIQVMGVNASVML